MIHTILPFFPQLAVETIDDSGRTLEGPVPLEVIVIDQNDNRPSFREGPYVGHVMEGSPTGRLAWEGIFEDSSG